MLVDLLLHLVDHVLLLINDLVFLTRRLTQTLNLLFHFCHLVLILRYLALVHLNLLLEGAVLPLFFLQLLLELLHAESELLYLVPAIRLRRFELLLQLLDDRFESVVLNLELT